LIPLPKLPLSRTAGSLDEIISNSDTSRRLNFSQFRKFETDVIAATQNSNGKYFKLKKFAKADLVTS
jgi:hypothetical protein